MGLARPQEHHPLGMVASRELLGSDTMPGGIMAFRIPGPDLDTLDVGVRQSLDTTRTRLCSASYYGDLPSWLRLDAANPNSSSWFAAPPGHI